MVAVSTQACLFPPYCAHISCAGHPDPYGPGLGCKCGLLHSSGGAGTLGPEHYTCEWCFGHSGLICNVYFLCPQGAPSAQCVRSALVVQIFKRVVVLETHIL